MRILRAAHLGMCFGVRDAIDLAVRRADTAPLTILGNLVHNDAVLASLRSRGIATANDPARVTTRTTREGMTPYGLVSGSGAWLTWAANIARDPSASKGSTPLSIR